MITQTITAESLPAWAFQPGRLTGETQVTSCAYTPQAASQPADSISEGSISEVGENARAAIPLPAKLGSLLAA
jgi:hypothetical protein